MALLFAGDTIKHALHPFCLLVLSIYQLFAINITQHNYNKNKITPKKMYEYIPEYKPYNSLGKKFTIITQKVNF